MHAESHDATTPYFSYDVNASLDITQSHELRNYLFYLYLIYIFFQWLRRAYTMFANTLDYCD